MATSKAEEDQAYGASTAEQAGAHCASTAGEAVAMVAMAVVVFKADVAAAHDASTADEAVIMATSKAEEAMAYGASTSWRLDVGGIRPLFLSGKGSRRLVALWRVGWRPPALRLVSLRSGPGGRCRGCF